MGLYCGMDLDSKCCQICVIDEKMKRLLEVRVINEIGSILSQIEPFKPDLKIVLESTFNWYWLVDGLQEAGYDVTLAHTLHLHAITQAKVKTDRRDAFTLAQLLKGGLIKASYIPFKEDREMRDLMRKRERLVHERSEGYTSIRRMLYQHGVHHTHESVMRMTEAVLQTWFSDASTWVVAMHTYERIRLLDRQIDDLETMVTSLAKDLIEYSFLTSIPGIGKILAMTILYEIGDINRFKSARHFSSYCRIVPGCATSGETVRRGRGTKQGNPHLKYALSQAAVYAVLRYDYIKDWFNKRLAKRKGKARRLICYNIVAHKLATAVFHVLRDRVPFKKEMLFV